MNNNKIGCVKAATKILGDKWTPQLIRCFYNEETLRFCQIQDLTTGINPRTLSARLTYLEDQGVISRTQCSDSTRCEYQLTEKGRQLAPILYDMQVWGERYASMPKTA